MKKSSMTASTLRIILTICIFLMVGLSAVGFYFAQDWLRTLAVDVSHTVADSTASGDNIQSLQKLQTELEAKQAISAKVGLLTTSTQEYQTQGIKDLKQYAALSGITISQYSFQPAAAAAPAVVATPGAVAATAVVNPTITVTLTSPISYTKLLNFMSLIENNLPKMQVSNITLGRINGERDNVTAQSLTVEVYTE
jgi:hypothetical protein